MQGKFRDDPPPDEIAVEFQAMISTEAHLCEECGYSTTTGLKEEDIFFFSKKFNLHFHKTCFLVTLNENRGSQAMKTVLDLLAQYWREIEEHRVFQYINHRQLAKNSNITSIATPSLNTDAKHGQCRWR